MLKRNRTGYTERGDTIVEVLVCILIISLVLAGAFTATNRSLQAVRDAQERSQASKLAEAQIEFIRSVEKPATGIFCFKQDGSYTMTDNTTSRSCHFTKNGHYKEAEGNVSPDGPAQGLYSSDEGVLYKTAVTQSGAGQPYNVSIRWITMKGQLGELKMYYKSAL